MKRKEQNEKEMKAEHKSKGINTKIEHYFNFLKTLNLPLYHFFKCIENIILFISVKQKLYLQYNKLAKGLIN